MNELLQNLLRRLTRTGELWRGLPPARRWLLLGVGAGVLAALGSFVFWMSREAYRPLYSGLDPAEAGRAVERLDELGVPYRLAHGGGTILVPEKSLDSTRLSMAVEGVPSRGRSGFELFDEANFGASEFTEQVNFRRALEGELERTIASLEEVREARVHISLPKRSVFLDDEEPGKASVVLRLEGSARPSQEQIRAIAFLTASAVEGLDPDDVVVMDHLGRLFTKRPGEGEELTQRQLAYRAELERVTVRKIVETLEPRLGPGGVRATVFAEVDWDSGEQTEEILDPNAVAMTTQRSEETTFDRVPEGVPGVAANLPREPAEPAETTQGLSRRLETTNFQTSRTVTRLDLERGEIERLSVAVLVDYRVEVDEEKRELVRVPREAEEIETIRELVMAASGAVEARGDTVTVRSLPFSMLESPPEPPPPPPDPSDEILSLEWVMKYRAYLLLGVIALVVLAALVAYFRRVRRKARIRAEREAALAAERERLELEEARQAELEKQKAEEERMLKGLKVAPTPTSKTQILKRHLEDVAKEDAESFARLIKAWIHEDD